MQIEMIRTRSGPSAVQLTLIGARVVHRWGQVGVLEHAREAEHPTPEIAARRFEDQVFRLVSKGYRIGVEHPGLIAAIAEAPGDPAGYLVYRDWLSEQGDARAELIRATGTLRTSAQLEPLLRAHRWQFVRRDWQPFEVLWWMGFVHTVRFPAWHAWLHPSRGAVRHGGRALVQGWARAFLLSLRRHPSGRFLQVVEEVHRSGRDALSMKRWAVEFDLVGEPWLVALREAADRPVALNFATEVDLQSLPGVGPRLARRILRLRERLNGFSSLDQLADVSGLGAGAIARLREHVRI